MFLHTFLPCLWSKVTMHSALRSVSLGVARASAVASASSPRAVLPAAAAAANSKRNCECCMGPWEEGGGERRKEGRGFILPYVCIIMACLCFSP